MLFLLSTLCLWSFAEPAFNFDDTGLDEDMDDGVTAIDRWPAKVVLDAPKNAMMLVWFETETPKHTTIQFSDIKQINILPKYELRPQELQVQLNDGRIFLLDCGKSTPNTAKTITAVTFKPLKQLHSTAERLVPKAGLERNAPVIMTMSIASKEALAPLSTVVYSSTMPTETDSNSLTLNEDENADGYTHRSQISLIIKHNMSRFQGCYIKELSKNPNLAGQVILQFQVNTEGQVVNAKVQESTLQNLKIEECLLRHIQGIPFDPSIGSDHIITFPFVFSASSL